MRYLFAIFCSIVISGLAAGDTAVDFERDIEPILQSHCIECHGSIDQSSGLRLDRRSSMLRGGDLGLPTIVPGDPSQSFLLKVIRGNNEHDLRMPPDGESLSTTHVDLIKRWIVEGALWPGQMSATADTIETDLWSLQPVDASSTPVRLSAIIDERIEARLAEADLSMSPGANPVTLLRRASLILTGLPPTQSDLDAYLSDAEGMSAAYVKAIDRLLDSPRYGERWAQHWLDVIRWAETVGFETNAARSNAWPYRDWVIQSFNDDKPYDRFLFEQIAGDTVGQDAALGFLVAGPANLPGQIGRDEEAMRQARQDELDEVIQTVSQSVLGLTIGCARCHNHKFDPILQSDYYSMQAVFAGLKYGDRRWRGKQNDEWTAKVPEAKETLGQLENQVEAERQRLGLKPASTSVQTDRFEPILAQAVRMEIAATNSGKPASLYELEVWTVDDGVGESRNVALASEGATPSASSFALANQTRHFDNLIDGSQDRRQAFPWVARDAGAAWVQVDFDQISRIERCVWDAGSSFPADYVLKVMDKEGDWIAVANSNDRWPHENDTRKADVVQLAGLSSTDVDAVLKLNTQLRSARSKLNRYAAGPKVFAANFSEISQPTWLLNRGDPMNRRSIVPPAIPRVLGDLELATDTPEVERRLALANHLIDKNHPLTSRVIVNRVWHHFFGSGLVDTPSDFGTMGSEPTHSELLDQLARGFVNGGWSLKKLHREMALSKTFQQSSRPDNRALEVDAETRLLWRFPPRRLEAEAIRDSILQASGKLDFKMGGPGFNLFKQRGGLSDYTSIETFDQKGWRRMIYAHKIRMQEVDIFGAFDCPDAGQMKPKRTQSITPTQSLSLFNSSFVIRQSEFFAQRLQSSAENVEEQVRQAFLITVSRQPDQEELSQMVKFVRHQGLEQLGRVLINTSEFLYIQ